jgi:lipopolysaccharide transport system ATP-binding protein
MVRHESVSLSGEGFIDFKIDELPLAGGTYTLGALIQLEERAADVLFGVVEMEVIDGDFFGTGRVRPLPSWSDPGALVRHSCEIYSDQAQRELVGVGE